MSSKKISRRLAINKATAIMGSTLSSSLMLGALSGCNEEVSLDWTPKALTPREVRLTSVLAEQILPATSTPGAKKARIEQFIDNMVEGYLTEAERSVFKTGLAWLAKRKFDRKTPERQVSLVEKLVEEARKEPQSQPKPFFLLAKEMVLLGFFTSEVGATEVLHYDPVPGGYLGCKPLQEVGGKTWAT